MATPSAKVILFNAAAGVIAIGAVAAVVRSWVVAPATLRPCSERYTTSMVFPLERDGTLLTATDIQARSGGSDAGVLQNLEVARLKKGPVPVAMGVDLPKGAPAPTAQSSAPVSGVSFPWQPRSLKNLNAVCLSYQVLVPSDFDFNLGGALPGVRGQDDESGDRFLVRLGWLQGGTLGVTNFMTLKGKKYRQQTDAENLALPRGRWVQLEQEVVMNSPDHENGVLRVWIDGALAIDRADFEYRAKAEMGLTGVAADLFYTGDDVAARSPADSKVWLSPFQVRWR